MSSIDAWYLWISVSTEKELAIPLNFLLKVIRMRSLREICLLLCRALPSAFSACAQRSSSYTGNACCRSQLCVHFPADVWPKFSNVSTCHERNKQTNHFLHTYFSAGIIGAASKQSQGYTFCYSLSCKTSLCSSLPRAKAKLKHSRKGQQRQD